MYLLRTLVILACAVYSAHAVAHCAACVGAIGEFRLNPYAICHGTFDGHEGTECRYSAHHSPAGWRCVYNAEGQLMETLSWSLCPRRVDTVEGGCGLCGPRA